MPQTEADCRFPGLCEVAGYEQERGRSGSGLGFQLLYGGYLKNIKTTTGDYIYRDEMNAGNFLGMPYKVSNQIPTDSKTGCTEMFFGNWAD